MQDVFRYQTWRYLPVDDILSLCHSSPTMEVICKDPETWRYLLERDFGIITERDPEETYWLAKRLDDWLNMTNKEEQFWEMIEIAKVELVGDPRGMDYPILDVINPNVFTARLVYLVSMLDMDTKYSFFDIFNTVTSNIHTFPTDIILRGKEHLLYFETTQELLLKEMIERHRRPIVSFKNLLFVPRDDDVLSISFDDPVIEILQQWT